MTSLLESRNANTGSSTELFWVTPSRKTIRYWIHVTYFSSLAATRIAFSLFSVADVEVIETDTSFWLFFRIFIGIVTLLLTIIALNVG